MSVTEQGKPPAWLLIVLGVVSVAMVFHGLFVLGSYSAATFWLILALFLLDRATRP